MVVLSFWLRKDEIYKYVPKNFFQKILLRVDRIDHSKLFPFELLLKMCSYSSGNRRNFEKMYAFSPVLQGILLVRNSLLFIKNSIFSFFYMEKSIFLQSKTKQEQQQ